jgi:hypothetical protein
MVTKTVAFLIRSVDMGIPSKEKLEQISLFECNEFPLKCQLSDNANFKRGHSSASLAALRVLRSSMAMVMGPTPPGTGVMAEATSLTSS